MRSQGVEIEGKKYKAGDLKKISRAERRVLDRLSAATGVDIVFFETEAGESGRFEGANGFYRDGTVYLDINAGASNVHQKSAVLLTAAHEFTHFIRENSPAQYEALKEFITERMLSDGREFAAMVRGKMNQIVDGKKLSHEDAVEEVIADACEMVFSDSKSTEALRKKDEGLWTALKSWMHDFLSDIREAFTGVEARHESAKAMNDYLSELAERFGVALAEASENAGAKEESGETKYSIKNTKELSLKEQLSLYYKNKMKVSDAFSFGNIDLSDVGLGAGQLAMTQTDYAKSAKGKHNTPRRVFNNLVDSLRNKKILSFGNNERTGVLIDDIDGDGKPILVALAKGTMDRSPVLLVNSVYGVEQWWVESQVTRNRELKIYDIEKATAFLQTVGYKAEVGEKGDFALIKTQGNENVKQKFSMRDEVEQTTRLVAVHNKSVSGLQRMLQRGGVPFPSIAVKKAGTPHEGFGDVSIVFPRATIDPAESQWNRLYSNDAWTPTEPRTEYDVGDTYNLQRLFENMAGSEVFHALRGSGRLSSDSLERELLNNNGDVFEAVKNLSLVKYGYLQSIGQRPEGATKEKTLDGFGRYKNEQLLAIFDAIDWETIKNAGHTDNDLAQRIADVLNEQYAAKYKDKPSTFKALKAKPLYTADKINIGIIRDAYRKWEAAGRKIETELDAYALEDALRDNKELVENEGYRRWVEDIFDGLIQDSGIPNGKEPYTSAGNPRSFAQRHVPATLENIVAQMRKEQERGVGTFGIELRGAASKSYAGIEDMRAESGRLLGERIDDDVHDSIMNGFYERLNDLKTRGAKGDSWDSRDSAEQLILEAIRDKKTKRSMDSFFQKESRWFNYSKALVDDVWQLKQDVQNMPVPYFEAKPRRNVSVEEALAYIVPDSTDAKLIAEMRQRGLNVLTYKEGDSADRLAKLNSVERAQFSRRDSTEGLTKEEAKEQARAYTKMKARAAKLEKQVKELKRELSKKPGKRVRPEDVRKLARELVQDYGSKANVDNVIELLQELGNRLVSGEELYWDDLLELAQSAAYEVLFDAVAYEDSREAYGDPDAIAKDIRGRRFKLSESELKGLPEGFRKQYSGKLHMGTKEGTSVDAAYAELQDSHGKGLFPDTLAAEDMMAVIADVYDRVTAKPTAYNPFQRNMNEAVNHVALDIMDTMLSEDIRQSPPTAMEKASSI